ncbi:MAG: FAD-dependent oxidoreductase [Alphaproteobacteria bacterium]|nr:FAD-dependent oxidoreductase [Alphaproteobacteria bacterium]
MDPSTLLPPHLRERTWRVGAAAEIGPGFVLCWLRVTLRADENPALDAAITLADALGRRLLVYQGLDERTPQATDRTHRFLLQGAAVLHADLAARGVRSVLHVARAGHRGPHLRTLASRAGLVVTDAAPLPPLRTWTDDLAARLAVPVLAVDSACLVPMTIDGPPGSVPPPDRAFAFRDRHARTRAARLIRRWPAVSAAPPAGPDDALPFRPIDLAALVDDPAALDRAIADLCADQEIDHGVPPVHDLRGGTAAGMDRWRRFRDTGLQGYHKTRNDPLRDGVSGLSPWLHFGMVSPFRIAREAFDAGGPGADKFLDELLVWRELAWHFCFHHPDPHAWTVVPDWARDSLQAHAADPRPTVFGWETLARGRTGQPLWDAAQKSLVLHGRLHNHLRMTWAKAAIPWSPDARDAFRVLLDLNDRLALDGRDPSSVGGVGWAFGLFDRPFPPARPITGLLRPRDVDGPRRTDPGRLARQVGAELRPSMPSVAVVGAGIAGLICARTLHDHGCRVTVFDKGRGPGGRTSTRRATIGADPVRFDHGAPAFAVDDPRLGRFVHSWRTEGRVVRWQGKAVRFRDGAAVPDDQPRWIAQPRMSALAAHLAADLSVRPSVRVARIAHQGGLHLWDEAGAALGRFDRVVLAVPGPQAAPLLEPCPALAAAARAAVMAPCLTAMLALDAPLAVDWDLARFDDHPVLETAHRCSAKPGHEGPLETWVLQATAAWSARHLERPLDDVAAALADALQTLAPAGIVWQQGHRWRYARSTGPGVGPRGHLWDADLGIGACGDWCRPSADLDHGVQAAWLSGVSLAGAMLTAEVDRPARGQTRLF